MTTTATKPSGELPFRTWTVLAPQLVAARRDWTAVRRLLAPHRNAVIYGWREEGRDPELVLGHVFLCAGEATAHLARLAAPSRLLRTREPEIRPRRTLAPVRLGDRIGDEKFLDDLCTRMASVTPSRPIQRSNGNGMRSPETSPVASRNSVSSLLNCGSG